MPVSWRALVPFKDGDLAKSRLADALTADQRRRLSRAMLDHVLGVLRGVPQIELIGLVSPRPALDADISWLPDGGGGLNVEVTRAREFWSDANILVVHSDLPRVAPRDLLTLLARAERFGMALAPDRHGSGTNAVAIKAGTAFGFQFGPDSFRAHAAFADPRAIVTLEGLSFDVDSVDDLAALNETSIGTQGAASDRVDVHGESGLEPWRALTRPCGSM